MIRPPLSCRRRNAAWWGRNVPRGFAANTLSQSSTAMLSAGAPGAIPAACTSTSSPRRASAAAAKAASTDALSDTSAAMNRACPGPAAVALSAISVPGPAWMSSEITRAPCAAKAPTMPAPIPLAPPVTMVRTPASESVIVESFRSGALAPASRLRNRPAKSVVDCAIDVFGWGWGWGLLEDCAGDFQLDDLVHVEAEFAQQLVGLLGT